jgi:preprotein translocase subunit SecA
MLNDRVFADDESRWRAVESDVRRMALTGRPLLVGCRTIERSEQLAGRLERMGIAYQLLNGKQTAEEAAIIAQAGRRGRVTIATNMAGRGTDIKLAPGVAEMGGMHLIAIERNDSRRVDLQLAGRVGRQGDPGSCQFFLSADDALFQRFGPDLCAQIRAMSNANGEVEAEVYRQIRSVQKRAEDEAYRARRQLADADTWLVDELGELMR